MRALCLLFALAWAAAAQPTSVINGDPLSCFSSVQGSVTRSIVDVAGQPFTKALRLKTNAVRPNPWDTRVVCNNTQPVRLGDTILVTLWARSSGSGDATFVFVSEHDKSPGYTKSVSWTEQVGPEWRKVQFPFHMLGNYSGASGTERYHLSFWVNYPDQQVDIADLSVQSYGNRRPFAELPLERPLYAGAEPDAPWRAEAARRIERYRKTDIGVVVRDEAGAPIAGAPVRVRMKRHAYGFGTAVAGAMLRDNPEYREKFLENFNKAVTENDLKWPDLESYSRPTAEYTMNFMAQHGIPLRGHNIIWPGRQWLPSRIVNLLGNPDALRTEVNKRIDSALSFTRGKVTEWDVLNEPYHNTDLQSVLGDAEMAEWFKRARANDPDVKLYINDFDITEKQGREVAHQDAYYRIIKDIIDRGAPLDGIGLQSHFGIDVTAPEKVWAILDRFAEFGKDLQVTEFDLNVMDEGFQAQYTRDYLTAFFAHPATVGFMKWGFWENSHWLPSGAMYRSDWSLKPNGQVWKDLTQKEWWTDVSGTTDANGGFRTRGFLGEYEVEVTAGGSTRTLPLTAVAGAPNYVRQGAAPAKGNIATVVNGASWQSGAVAPGEIVTIYGAGLGANGGVQGFGDFEGRLSKWAGDTVVLVNGVPAPVVHSYPQQVSAVVPYGTAGRATIRVEYQGVMSNEVEVDVAAAAPGIFTADYSGSGQAVAENVHPAGQERNSKERPAAPGQFMTIYITGEGATTPAGTDGVAPVYPNNPRPAAPVTVHVGGADVQPEWVGVIYAGVTQINFRLPQNVSTGDAVPLAVTVGSVRSRDGVTVAVR